jgi:hypothetical protein
MASWRLPDQNVGVKGRRPGCPAAFTLVRKGETPSNSTDAYGDCLHAGQSVWPQDNSAIDQGGLAHSNKIFRRDREAEGYLG